MLSKLARASTRFKTTPSAIAAKPTLITAGVLGRCQYPTTTALAIRMQSGVANRVTQGIPPHEC